MIPLSRVRRGLGALVAALVGTALALQASGPVQAGPRTGHRIDHVAHRAAHQARHHSRHQAGHPIGAGFFGLHARNLADTLPAASFGSVDLTTDKVYWPDLEPYPGTFDFSTLDTLVVQAHRRGAKPMLVLGKTPAFYSTDPGAPNARATVPEMAAWKKYVTKVVTRYQDTLDYEVWPEPNITENWAGTPQQLADLFSAAATIIHAKAPRAVVVSPAFVLRMKFEENFMKHFFTSRTSGKPVGQFVDAVGLDLYPLANGTPEDSLALLRSTRAFLRQHKVTAPIWNAEINYGVVGGHSPVVDPWSDRKQQSYLVRNYLLDAGDGVKRVFWLGWFPVAAVAIQLVEADGVTRTPAARSLAVVQKWLTGRRVSACARAAKSHVWSCRLSKKGKVSRVYWVTQGKAHVRTPRTSHHVTTMTGATSRTHPGRRLKVTSAPIWVHP
jgi:hypothetical protein